MGRKYTQEYLVEIKNIYPTRFDLHLYDIDLYNRLRNKKILNYLYPDSISDGKFKNKFTTEEIFDMVKDFKTKKEIYEFYPSLRKISKRMGIWDEICKKLEPVGNPYNRLVYAYEFNDNSVYVGLTYNEDIRDKFHTGIYGVKYSGVYDHIKKTNLNPNKKIISDGYIDYIKAVDLEISTIDDYRKNGWNILNKVKGGGLGGGKHRVIRYTDEYIRQEASKYDKIGDFKKKSTGCYQAMRRKGKEFREEMTKHMKCIYKKYTDEGIKEEVLKYNNIKSFNKDRNLCEAVRRRGKEFQKEMTKHMYPYLE